MDPSGALAIAAGLLKLPFLLAFKILLLPLNLIPTRVYELHGFAGENATNRPDVRAFRILQQGRRCLPLGLVLVAYQRGALITKAPISFHGETCWGVYSEDFEDIRRKWAF